MADVNETLARERKWLDGGLGMTQRTQHKLLSAVENVLALHVKKHGEQDGIPIEYCYADSDDYPCPTVKAITDALGATDE